MAPPEKALASRRHARQEKGTIRSTYDFVVSPENAAFLRSVAAFCVGVAFLNSPWAEWLFTALWEVCDKAWPS